MGRLSAWGAMGAVLTVGALLGCATPRTQFAFPESSLAEDPAGATSVPDVEPGNVRREPAAEPGAQVSAPEIVRGSGPRIGKPLQEEPVRTDAGEITLNFEDTDIREVVKSVLGDLLQENYLLDPKVQGKVTLQTSRPLSREALVPVLETVLRMNSAVLVASDGLYRIMPAASAAGSVAPRTAGSQGNGYQAIVVPLKYVAAKEMEKVLQPLLPKGEILQVDARRNLLIVSGTLEERRSILDAVSIFDVDWLKGMSVGLFPLEHVDAKTLTTDLGKVFGDQADAGLDGVLKFLPIERLNAVLVITHQERYLDAAREWIKRLDRGGGGDGQQLYVYRVQNGKAEKLAEILQELFGQVSSKPKATNASRLLAPGLEPAEIGKKVETSPEPGPGPAAPRVEKRGGQGLNVDGIGEVGIIADTENNALVILASPADFRRIEPAIRRLDIVPLQVLIEASIVEISLTDELSYGLEWFFKNNNVLDNKTGFGQLDLGAPGLAPVAPGFSYSLVTSAGAVRAVLNTLASQSKLNVLSSPSLMVLDNQTAQIRVGDQQPVRTGTSTTTGGVIIESIQYKDTGVMLQVTPRVNAGGLVTMEVSQDVTDVGDIDAATGQRSFLQRSIKSTVAVQSGETVVLGGLIKDNNSHSDSGVPGLHKIPFVGALFGRTSKVQDRTELVVLLTPKAIRNHREARKVTEEFKKKLTGLWESKREEQPAEERDRRAE